jgi:hypothetical protein
MGVTGINHIACRTPDVARLKVSYEELLGAEPLAGSHDPLRVGTVILVFVESARASVGDDPDEIAFDAHAASFAANLGRARGMDVVTQDLVEPTPWSRALLSATPTAATSRSLTTTTASTGARTRAPNPPAPCMHVCSASPVAPRSSSARGT